MAELISYVCPRCGRSFMTYVPDGYCLSCTVKLKEEELANEVATADPAGDP